MSEGLIRSILARTSGAPCASARDRLVPFVDGELEALDTDLMRMHADGCSDCAALARVLQRLARDLPRLAQVEPDLRFAADVLARTSSRRSLADRFVAFLAASMQRPRIAWEAAYVVTFVLALVFAAPGSPLAGVPGKALELAQVNPVAEISRPAQGLKASLSRKVLSAWERSAGEIRATLAAVRDGFEERAAAIADSVRHGLGTAPEPDASERGEREKMESARENER